MTRKKVDFTLKFLSKTWNKIKFFFLFFFFFTIAVINKVEKQKELKQEGKECLNWQEKKVLIEIGSWEKNNQHEMTNFDSSSDQGPYHFRKILRPTFYDLNKKNEQESMHVDKHFDFRKLLRHTYHAPTDEKM